MRIGRLIDPRFQDVVRKLQIAHVPLKGAYKLKGIVKVIDEEIVKYEELRKGALEKFGKRDDAGAVEKDENGNVVFSDEQRASFMSEINDLLNLEVAVPKMNIDDLGSNIEISVEDLFFIEDLFDS
jgi:hypothetical protein